MWYIECFNPLYYSCIHTSLAHPQSGHCVLPHPLTLSLTMACFGQSQSVLILRLDIPLALLYFMPLLVNGTYHGVFVQVVLTEYHRLGVLQMTNIYFSQFLEGGKSTFKPLADSVSDGGPHPGL